MDHSREPLEQGARLCHPRLETLLPSRATRKTALFATPPTQRQAPRYKQTTDAVSTIQSSDISSFAEIGSLTSPKNAGQLDPTPSSASATPITSPTINQSALGPPAVDLSCLEQSPYGPETHKTSALEHTCTTQSYSSQRSPQLHSQDQPRQVQGAHPSSFVDVESRPASDSFNLHPVASGPVELLKDVVRTVRNTELTGHSVEQAIIIDTVLAQVVSQFESVMADTLVAAIPPRDETAPPTNTPIRPQNSTTPAQPDMTKFMIETLAAHFKAHDDIQKVVDPEPRAARANWPDHGSSSFSWAEEVEENIEQEGGEPARNGGDHDDMCEQQGQSQDDRIVQQQAHPPQLTNGACIPFWWRESLTQSAGFFRDHLYQRYRPSPLSNVVSMCDQAGEMGVISDGKDAGHVPATE